MSDAAGLEARQALQRLARDYLAQLQAELSSAQALARQCAQAVPAPALIEAVHRLAGSSLSFGYSDLGTQLQSLEHALRLAQDAGQPAAEAMAALGALQPPLELASLFDAAAASAAPMAAEDKAPADPATPGATRAAEAAKDVPAQGPPRALIIDPYQWLSPAVESVVQAYGFETRRAVPGECAEPCELVIKCTASPTAEGQVPPSRALILVIPRDGYAERLGAVRRGAKALLTTPLDLPSLERVLQVLTLAQEQRPHRVLLVDDDALLLERYRLALAAAGLDVRVLSRPETLFEVLDEFRPDVLVLDLNLPGCSGLELAQAVRYSDAWLQMPILFLSAQRSRQVEALTAAGEEFLSKPIAPELLVAQVISRARRGRALASGLTRDGLTGLLRQNDARQRLAAAAARAATQSQPLSVALIDLDHFKRVNDTHGHAAGDIVLRTLANSLRRRLRGSDFAGRLGGEEFLLVLEDCSAQDALSLVDRLRREFAQIEFEGPGTAWTCTFSAGLASLVPADTPGSLLERADQALYAAKAQGRNRCVSASTATGPA
ncbi:GGDEF domain-containing protein [Aquimonas voraii]|uniref:diguanylate cyclase n=1 Tax=Aquimonas voraii TaxID=265719 RepID=A0A1G6U080_9GAMM|nr:diguanylate cyclase [Aquimonas voraii]SDD33945.1 response regulator receiver modulated diguanylate cyclase [Aquimonas voraii]